jgi:hypothetical protein
MAHLSTAFGDAQYFATHRGSSYTAWARYVAGQEVRLFAYADDLIHDVGEALPDERRILARLPDRGTAELEDSTPDLDDRQPPEEDDVFTLAAAWSLDPSSLETQQLAPSTGLLGLASGDLQAGTTAC